MYTVSIALNFDHPHMVVAREEADIASEDGQIPPEYEDLKEIFSKTRAQTVPGHGPQDLTIDLVEGKKPPWCLIYDLLANELETLCNYRDENLVRGWMRPSTSSAGALVFFVPKNDGNLQQFVDYGGLNQIFGKNCYPLPLISQAIDRISGTKFYTKLNICDAYHRV
jgi:hypothetical protein